MDIAVVVGHSADAKGARACDGSWEWDWMRQLGPQVVEALRLEGVAAVEILRSADLDGYRAKMRDLCERINAVHPRAVLALHWNAVPGDWSGTLALHWPGSGRGERLAAGLSRAAATSLGLLDRGAVPQARSWASYELDDLGRSHPTGPLLYILRDTLAPCAVLELGNSANPTDLAAVQAGIQSGELALAIARGCAAWLGR